MNLFNWGEFKSNSELTLPFKIDCDALSDEDIACIARIIASKTEFGIVLGVPRGGDRLANALATHAAPEAPCNTLIVDDVLTTGASMEAAKKRLSERTFEKDIIGWVIFARTKPPNWVNAVFKLGDKIS